MFESPTKRLNIKRVDRLSFNQFSPRTREEIELNYLQNRDLPISEIEIPPSSHELLKNIDLELNTLKENKFIGHIDSSDFQDLYSSIRSHTIKIDPPKQETSDEKEKIYELQRDPEIAFWLSTSTVKDIIKRIKRLPFKHQDNLNECLTKVTDKATYTAHMIKKNKIESKKRTLQQEKEKMRYFITEMQSYERDLIESALKSDMLWPDRLPEDMRPIYAKYRQPKAVDVIDSDANVEIEKVVFDMFAKSSRKIPLNYRFDPSFGTTPESKENIMSTARNFVNHQFRDVLDNIPIKEAAETSRNSPIRYSDVHSDLMVTSKSSHSIYNAPGRRRAPKMKKIGLTHEMNLPRNEVIKQYWEDTDPLSRTGYKFNILEQMKEMGSSINFKKEEAKYLPEEICYPFEPDDIKQTARDNEKKSQESSIGLEKNELFTSVVSVLLENEEEEELEEKRKKEEEEKEKQRLNEENERKKREMEASRMSTSLYVSMNDLSTPKCSEDAIKYLKQSSVFSSFSDTSGQTLLDQLHNIWNELGFTFLQKIALLAKYSENLEETKRLGASLSFWETTFAVVGLYNQKYHQLKNYFIFESYNGRYTSKEFKNIFNEFVSAEKSLIENANRLKAVFGDDLIIKGRVYKDIINSRRTKINSKLSMYEIPGIREFSRIL